VLSGVISLLVSGENIKSPMMRFIANAGLPHGAKRGAGYKNNRSAQECRSRGSWHMAK
jgi:hypothetical protein